MDQSIIFGIFAAVVVLSFVVRLFAGALDGDRVEAYIHDLGGELIDRSWDPLGPGWFGEKDSRIYEIVYRDRDGRTHRAHVKTSALSGVYLTNDRIIEDAPVEDEKARLEKRLRELDALSDQQRRLQQLDEWKQKQLLSESEYEARRAEILKSA
jgi:hypothetical protein